MMTVDSVKQRVTQNIQPKGTQSQPHAQTNMK